MHEYTMFNKIVFVTILQIVSGFSLYKSFTKFLSELFWL